MKKYNEWNDLTKKYFWITIAYAIIGVLNVIAFAVVSSLNLVEMSKLSYLFWVVYMVAIFVPLLFAIFLKTKFDLWFYITFELYLALAILVGSLWRLYHITDGYDKFVHVVFGAMIAWIAYYVFFKSENIKENKCSLFFIFIFIFSFSMMSGAVWEMFEFACDGVLGIDAQVTQGFVGREAIMNTMFDIICDFSGGLFASIVVVIMNILKRKKQVD